MLAASVLFAGMGLGIKVASQHVDAGQLVWWRNAVQLVGAVTIARARGVSLTVVDRPALWRRCGFGTIAMVAYFGAIARLPLGDAVLLTYTMPVFVALFSPSVTGETRSPGLVPALAVGLVGVALVADPRFSPDPVGVALGLLAAVSSGVAYGWLRVSTRSEPRERIVVWFSVACVVATTPSWLGGGPPWTWDGVGALVAAGGFGLAATLLMTTAYAHGPTDVVALFSYATPVAAYVAAALVLREPVTWQAMGGVALVALSGLLVRPPAAPPQQASPSGG